MSKINEVIERGTDQFLVLPNLPERLEWWLLSAYSSERWMQFEWAFSVSKAFSKEFVVSCEHKLVDVALFQQRPDLKWPIWENEPAIGFELKWLGNWYHQGRAEGVAQDVIKIEKKPYPSAALAFWLEVEANPADLEYAWIQKQIETKIGGSQSEMEELLTQKIGRPHDIYLVKEIPAIRCQKLKLHIYGYENHVKMKQ